MLSFLNEDLRVQVALLDRFGNLVADDTRIASIQQHLPNLQPILVTNNRRTPAEGRRLKNAS